MAVIWSYNAMAAIPTPETAEAQLYDARAGRVVFREGQVGLVVLECPVPAELHNRYVRSLFLTYQDGDSPDPTSSSSVSAALRFVRRSDGHVATVENGNVSSNHEDAPSSGPTGWVTHQSATAGHVIQNSHTMNFDENYYYVQIALERTDPDVPVGVMGVYLID